MAVVAALLLASSPAAAKTAREYPYAYQPVFKALVRFLRVDENLKVVEKDRDDGYILFELSEDNRTFRGAAEVLGRKRSTRVVIRISDRPAYMEGGLLDRFAVKLREELGAPQPEPPASPPPSPPPKETKP